MKITTNYSKYDWFKFIPNMIISLIPTMFFIIAVLWLYIPFLDTWIIWMDFHADINSIGGFAEYVKENQLMKSPDEFVVFMFLTLFGSALFPVLIIVMFYKIIPINFIIKKLKIEPMMKLVIFKNGKPIRKVRDLIK